MLIGLNKNEGCTVVINHTDTSKTHSVVISNFDDEKLHIREFNSPTSDNSDYTSAFSAEIIAFDCEGVFSHNQIDDLSTRLNSVIINKQNCV